MTKSVDMLDADESPYPEIAIWITIGNETHVRRDSMPRPTDKNSLLALSETNFRKLLEFIDSLPED